MQTKADGYRVATSALGTVQQEAVPGWCALPAHTQALEPTAVLVFFYHTRQGCSHYLGPDHWSSPHKKGLQTRWMKDLHRAPRENFGSCSEPSPGAEQGGQEEAGQPGEPLTATLHTLLSHTNLTALSEAVCALALGSWL